MAANSMFPPPVRRFFKPFGNKYFLVLAVFFFWLIFIDKRNVITQFSLQRSVNQLKADKEFYQKKIQEAHEAREDLEINKEKYAREHYYMKKPNEDVFIIEKD
ncbi:MAG: septum formation initiator family protein [Saprospiraceae bacterium]|nr:septum formation initiator family protein [Saprospiraceae bacterium]